ncbi:MAG: DUF4132 domain-containing protein [Gemmataceae bacterium]|nr:DUF4132 domain-containing protein [Gemmataceae bacterium]
MKMRELHKKGVRGVWQIYVKATDLIIEHEDGSGTYWGEADEKSAAKEFEAKLKAKEKQGWHETGCSLSRRVFHHTKTKPGKFWNIWLDDSSVVVHYGKIPKYTAHWSKRTGQTKTKEFPSRDAALKAYEKLIAGKLVEGYEEHYARDTEYSRLGKELAARKRSTPRTPKPRKEPAPEQNLAQVLGEGPRREVNLEVTRQIDLDASDWFAASWKPWTPIPRPAPQPFDREACEERARKVKSFFASNWAQQLQVPLAMTRPEAAFWFSLFASIDYKEPLAEVVKSLPKSDELGPDQIRKRLKKVVYFHPEMLRALAHLIGPEELLSNYIEIRGNGNNIVAETTCFRDNVLLHCTNAQLASLRRLVANLIDVHVKPTKSWDYYPASVYFGAMLGCHKELRQIVQGWQDPALPVTYPALYHPPEFVLALGSPEIIESEFRRLKLKWDRPEHIRGWLATTELRALDVVRDAILAITNKQHCEDMLAVFARVKAPEAAEHMLELSKSAKSPRLAREWLETEVGNAIAGLVSVAAGKGKLAGAALQYLRDQNRTGHTATIAAAAKRASADLAAFVQREVLERVEKVYPELSEKSAPAWLTKSAKQASTLRPLPGAGFVDLARLPAVVIDGRRLPPAHVAAILLALQNAELAAPPELLIGLKGHADTDSLDAFAWSLFEAWMGEGAPIKQKWAMLSLGFLGSDAAALRLAPLIRAWPGENQHPRAVLGLECLRAIGTDTALMQLNGISQKLKFPALKNKARELMEAIAGDKGLTKSELEDRIVPDCDLDERGSRVFDFGPRKFRFVLGPGVKPMVKDEEDRVKPDLPRPAAKDDAAKAEQAVKEWKLLKKQVAEVASIQAVRLEQAMVVGRRWRLADFEMLLVKQPLMANLVRLLLWAGYDKKGKLATTFRVTEDQTYADVGDAACTLKGIDSVGVLHPLHLADELKGAWGEVFGDYEIIPPFPQLGRPIFALENTERRQKDVKRFDRVKLPAPTLVFGLEKRGWTRGLGMDAGCFDEHSKPFPAADVTAVVRYDGSVGMGYIQPDELLSIVEFYFVAGFRGPGGFARNEKKLTLGDMDAVVLSEVLSDVTALTAKGT